MMCPVIKHPVWFATFVAGSLLAIFGFALAGSEFSDEDLSGWIEALATVAAFTAAVIAAVYAASAFRLEQGRDEARQDAEERQQANQVAAWYLDNASRTAPPHPGYTLANNSALPIYDAEIRVHWKDALLQGVVTKRLVVPGDTQTATFEGAIRLVLTTTHAARVAEAAMVAAGQKPRHSPPAVTLRFRDSANVTWDRDATGRLTKVVDQPTA